LLNETVSVVRKHPPPGLFGGLVNLVIQLYRADDNVVEQLKILVTRYFPDEEFKALALDMVDSWNTASDIMARLSDEELQKILSHPTDKAKLKLYLGRLDSDLWAYAGKERYRRFLKKPEARLCETPFQTGFLLWSEIKAEFYSTLLLLLHKIMRRIEVTMGGDIPTTLGGFVAGRIEKFSSGIIRGDTMKYDEERTALMAFAAAAIYPNSVFDVEKSQILLSHVMEVAVRVTGLRFATHFSAYLRPFEHSARKEWFELWNSETTAALLAWIEKGTEGTSYKKFITFAVQPTYLSSNQQLYDGKFPTPFLAVPDSFWKKVVESGDMFPVDLMQGHVPLVPLDVELLNLFPTDKQSSCIGIYGPRFSGKTVLLDALACTSIDRGYTVLRPAMRRDQGLTSIMPMMPYAKDDYKYLTEQLRLKPRKFLAKFITVADSQHDINRLSACTVCDEVYLVDGLESFHLPWKKILKELGPGYLIFRQLADETRTQLMRGSLIQDFFEYRMNDRHFKICLEIDEIQDVFGAVFRSAEEARVVRTLQTWLADIRGLNLSLFFGTIRPASLQPEILEMLSAFVFGELRESGADRTHSSRGRMLEALKPHLPDSERPFLPLVEKIMENIDMLKLHLLFLVGDDGRFRLVRSMLPPHMLEDPNVEPKRQFEQYEKETGESVLQTWDEVKTHDLTGGQRDQLGAQGDRPYSG
jgi:hypothetical protein